VGGSKVNLMKEKIKRNWKEYNERLIRRGTIEIEEGVLKDWSKELRKMNKKKEGRPFNYPDTFMKFIGLVKMKIMFSYRKLHGFLRMFSAFFTVPDYSQIFRRMGSLKLSIEDSLPEFNEPLFVSIDASGLQADNGGTWLRNKHKSKKQKWIKIHFVIDVKSKRILEFKVTTDKVHDNKRFRGLIRKTSRKHDIKKAAADPGYDDHKNYLLCDKKGIEPIIKPKRSANPYAISCNSEKYKEHKPRIKVIKDFQKLGYKKWRDKTGYNYRTLNESAFHSFKSQYGHAVSSKKMKYVRQEILWKVFSYNLSF
jgi:hypothetical protein